MIQRDRKSELVEIAYRLIAQNGLEGFRIRQVAAEARMDNGTMHYHFPSKEALILGVVDYLMEDLTNNRAVWKGGEQTALDELRLEFEDIRLRLHRTPEQAGAVCYALVILITAPTNLRTNKQIAHWSIQNPPREWAQIRARWLRFHVIRTLFSFPALAIYLVAVISNARHL